MTTNCKLRETDNVPMYDAELFYSLSFSHLLPFKFDMFTPKTESTRLIIIMMIIIIMIIITIMIIIIIIVTIIYLGSTYKVQWKVLLPNYTVNKRKCILLKLVKN